MNYTFRFLLSAAIMSFAMPHAFAQTKSSQEPSQSPSPHLVSQTHQAQLEIYIDNFNRVFSLAADTRGGISELLEDPTLASLSKEEQHWLRGQLAAKVWPQKLQIKKVGSNLEIHSPQSKSPLLKLGLKRFGEKPVVSFHDRDIDIGKFLDAKLPLPELHAELQKELANFENFKASMRSLNFFETMAAAILFPVAVLTGCTGRDSSEGALAAATSRGNNFPVATGSVRGFSAPYVPRNSSH